MTYYNETKEIQEKAHSVRKALWTLIGQIQRDVGPTGQEWKLKCNDMLLWLKSLEEGTDVDDGHDEAVWPPEEVQA